MSSMVRIPLIALTLMVAPILTSSMPLVAQGSGWQTARSELIATAPRGPAATVSRWEILANSESLSFDSYAGFLLAYPGFPREDLLRTRAENALDREPASSQKLVAYFRTHPPLTNPARARDALALAALQQPEAAKVARDAWRSGEMSAPSEAYLAGMFGAQFSQADHDARMDALLWQNDAEAAVRQIMNTSAQNRGLYMARLALLQGQTPSRAGLTVPAGAQSDLGYIYNLTRYYRTTRQAGMANSLLSNRQPANAPAFDADALIKEMLVNARTGGARAAQRIAASVDDLFAPGTDVSKGSFRLRDDYTSLMWLGGTKAMWDLRDGNAAAPLFYRYGAAARTPQTRSKGFYWAGYAARKGGDIGAATRYFEEAAQYPEYFYGLLAAEALGRPLPQFANAPAAMPTAEERAAFQASPLVAAVESIARGGVDWRTARYFFVALVDGAQTPGEMALIGDLASRVGLPELAVVVGRTAPEKNFSGFQRVGFPTVEIPQGADWTWVHAISRQESEFDERRISHAGARGVMQLMPGTAREQAGKLSMRYVQSNLLNAPQYNITLGDAYFARMLSYYDGSYPLAVAAYNAGPGNVNKWLRRNGDPRRSGMDWVEWIERIPIFETKNYVARVLENATVYEIMHPQRTVYGKPRPVSSLLR